MGVSQNLSVGCQDVLFQSCFQKYNWFRRHFSSDKKARNGDIRNCVKHVVGRINQDFGQIVHFGVQA